MLAPQETESKKAADVRKVPSGIPGLDDLTEGGFWPKSTIVILGSSGTGKSTFAVQFLMEGIEQGEQALYVSLEEPPEQIMREGDLMGFDLRKHYEKSLFFIHLKGKNFKKMIEEQLPQLVKARADYNIPTRVVIDPMTPVIWATQDKLEQRELIGKLFYTLKELGVVLCTVEEHSRPGETIGEDILLPIYLSDGAIHLEYYPIGGAFNRTAKILKMRGVHHGEGVYPYIFARGVGIVVRASPVRVPEESGRSHTKTFEDAIRTAESLQAPPRIIEKLRRMQEHWDYDYSPEEALEVLFRSYGLRRGG
jgi:KaiC/GvpD/RAD55 family RecA-like ATPase